MFFKKRQLVQVGFDKIKQEFATVHEWLYYFYQFNQHLIDFIKDQDRRLNNQEDELDEVKLALKNLPKTREEFKEIVDSYYSFENIMDRLKEVENRMSLVQSKITAPRPQKISESSLNIREKVLKKIARSSKDYIKNFILNLVSKYGKVSALQLREIIVEEQGLCSKSSFYRILEELEREDTLNIISKGKLKIYLAAQNTLAREQETI